MKTIGSFCIFLFMLILPGGALPVTVTAQHRKVARAQTVKAPSSAAMADLLKRAQTTVEQAQAEAQRMREQNEELLRRVAQNSEELAALRKSMADLGAQLTSLQQDKNAVNADATAKIKAVTPVVENAQAAIKILQTDLEIVKEQSEVHTAQLKEHAQTKVESESKTRVKFYGTILANTYFNTADSSLNDVPLFAPPPTSTARKNNLGGTLRQTRLGFLFNGATLTNKLGGPRASAEAEFDFWGGEYPEVTGSFRIVTASVRLDWDRTSIVAGQRAPLISPRNPSSLGAVWFPSFSAAGNLWQWRPQLTVERRIKGGDSTEWQLQGGMLTPFGGTVQGTPIDGGPGYEGRVGFIHTLESEQKVEFGFGSYIHRRPFGFGRKVNSFAYTGDWAVPLGERFEFSGEAYAGRAINLGDIPGGNNDRHYAITGALSNAATTVNGIFEAGGWAQFTYKARPNLDFHVAYGQEDPRNRELLAGQISSATRFKNQSASTNFIWTWRQNFLLSLEYRRFWTDYNTKRQKSGQYNLAIGYTF